MQDQKETTAEEFKRCIMGALEVACFLKQGTQRFGQTIQEVIRSFSIFLLAVPLDFIAISLLRETEPAMQKVPLLVLFFIGLQRIVMLVFIKLVVIFTYCNINNKKDRFTAYVSGANWIDLLPLLIITPLLLMGLVGMHPIAETEPLHIIFYLYSLFVYGFFLAHVLDIRWHVAALFTFFFHLVGVATQDMIFNP